jgi:hypothetical protein
MKVPALEQTGRCTLRQRAFQLLDVVLQARTCRGASVPTDLLPAIYKESKFRCDLPAVAHRGGAGPAAVPHPPLTV